MSMWMMFDVESIGLHGEGYAVGWVVVDESGKRLDEGCYCCDPADAEGSDQGRTWIAANAPDMRRTHNTPFGVRDAFWARWNTWRERGALLVADCGWPVEARFLAACVDDNPASREWRSPYPLHELASLMLACGRDPLTTHERLPDELPAHDPLADARQSARLLISLGAQVAQVARLKDRLAKWEAIAERDHGAPIETVDDLREQIGQLKDSIREANENAPRALTDALAALAAAVNERDVARAEVIAVVNSTKVER